MKTNYLLHRGFPLIRHIPYTQEVPVALEDRVNLEERIPKAQVLHVDLVVRWVHVALGYLVNRLVL